MKTKSIFISALLASAALFSSCSKDDSQGLDAESLALLSVSTKASTEGVSTYLVNNICPILTVTAPLTADEIEFLFVIREDEKLTRDVTSAFIALYPTSNQFVNIATAEATHIAAVETLLGYYEISAPALTNAGVFADEVRQAQYNRLISQGTTLTDAYKSTALLEEEGIAAYMAVLPNVVNANIKLLVENMIKASSNHLRAYVRQITALGGVYTPTILDQASFDAIANSAFGQGNKYGQQGGSNGKGGNTNAQKGGMGQGNKGSVNGTGTCTGCTNGSTPGTNQGQGQTGKGYRGGR